MATLSQRVKNWINTRGKTGHEGVALIADLVQQMAGKDHDWNAAAEFLKATDNARDGTPNRALRLALRCYFGDLIKLRKDASHPTGYRFAYGESGKWPVGSLAPRNTWGAMVEAVERKLSLDDKDFMKLLTSQFKKDAEEPSDEAIRVAYQKAGERLAKKLYNDGVNMTVVIKAMEKTIAALKAQAKEETALVIKEPKNSNGAVIEDIDDIKAKTAAA